MPAFCWGSFCLSKDVMKRACGFLARQRSWLLENPEYSFELVEGYHLKGDARAAVDRARRLVTRFPNHPGSYLSLATGLKLDGEFDRAKLLLERSLKLASALESSAHRDLWAQAAFHLASILRKEGAFQKSIELLNQVVRERPEPAALLELSHCHIQNGDPGKALPYVGTGHESRPGQPGTAIRARHGPVEARSNCRGTQRIRTLRASAEEHGGTRRIILSLRK